MADYKRLMGFGEWLNRYLSPELTSWSVGDLANDAVRILNVDFLRKPDEDRAVVIIKAILEDSCSPTPLSEGAVDRKIIETLNDVSSKNQLPEELVKDVSGFFKYIHSVKGMVKYMAEFPSVPWSYRLANFEETFANRPNASPFLLAEYNNIRQVLIARDRQLMTVNEFVFPKTGYNEKWVRFPAMICRIFISFLQEGGLDYCDFCKNCGKFILAERKGRRQFCGGKCRIAYKRMKDKG